MSNELHGLCVLNTRPLNQSQPLTDAILAKGGQVISFPLLDIVGTALTWKKKLPPLEKINQAIFTSANAVHYFFSAIKTLAPTTKIIAIGNGTALALKKEGLEVDCLPKEPSSEGLLALASLQAIEQQTILLVKGEGGRALLSPILISRGAILIELPVYKRIIPQPTRLLPAIFWQDTPINIILVTSQEAMENCFKLVPVSAHEQLKQIPWLVMSERLALIAKQLGVKNPQSCRPDNIIETLCQFKKDLVDGQ